MDGSRVKSFSQETEAIGQHSPRIGAYKPKLHSRSHVQDAQDSLTSLPIFFLQAERAEAPGSFVSRSGGLCDGHIARLRAFLSPASAAGTSSRSLICEARL